MTPPATAPAPMSDAAFGRALERERPSLMRSARYLLRSSHYPTPDDLVQDTMLSAWRARHAYSEQERLGAWLGMIMRNRLLSTIRVEKKRGLTSLPDGYDVPHPASAETRLALHDVVASLGMLPAKMQASIMAVVAGVPYDAQAADTGESEGTLKCRTFRARQMLGAVGDYL